MQCLRCSLTRNEQTYIIYPSLWFVLLMIRGYWQLTFSLVSPVTPGSFQHFQILWGKYSNYQAADCSGLFTWLSKISILFRKVLWCNFHDFLDNSIWPIFFLVKKLFWKKRLSCWLMWYCYRFLSYLFNFKSVCKCKWTKVRIQEEKGISKPSKWTVLSVFSKSQYQHLLLYVNLNVPIRIHKFSYSLYILFTYTHTEFLDLKFAQS